MRSRGVAAAALILAAILAPARADYLNFESPHVHPIELTPLGSRLLVVNTPDARLEVFRVGAAGSLILERSIAVGLEPVTVRARSETEAWVVNHLSDSISVVNPISGTTIRTLPVSDEPTDVVFARGKAFIAVSQEDAVKAFDMADPNNPPIRIQMFGSDAHALAVSPDGGTVYAVALHSGNQTTIVNSNVIAANNSGLDPSRLSALGLNNITCNGPPAPYPPLPPGITRNPLLNDPAPPAQPPVSLIVKWNGASSRWEDEASQNWTHCLPYRLPDHDLYVIDANSPGPPATIDHLGTTLFAVSVNPADGRVWVPHTDARNFVRFEHPLGVQGHMVDNRVAIVDPNAGNAVTIFDLNSHINRASDPATNLTERLASISQPGMMVWNAAGSRAWLTAIGSRKIFRVDNGATTAAQIFGVDRSAPDAVEVGEGPTGAALDEMRDRVYVLNRFSNTIAIVAATAMIKLDEVPLHDPSSPTIRNGRRLLYDGIDSSAHGDAACSSCHIFGNLDELAWDLGDPEGSFAPYGTPGDNVRFIVPIGGAPATCDPSICAAHAGFDPQKGPMATQTLRGMLEPLHWRGDRGTMNDFNMAFVGLMGTEDLGPLNGKPAGLTAPQMELLRRFALGIAFPPNPFRNVDDSLPNATITLFGHQQPGNPAAGALLFSTGNRDAGQPCSSCHNFPFGAADGKLGGVEPGDPPSARAALFNGTADGSLHSDLKVPHLRNMYEKFGPRFGSHVDPNDPPADQRSGFGFTHDGAIPDMATFLSAGVFHLTAPQVRDLSMFMFFFPSGVRPSVGRHVTVPAGPPADPNTPPERLLSTLLRVGNAADPNRHCELVAWGLASGAPPRARSWSLDGGVFTGGLWTTDVGGEVQITTESLRSLAAGPLTFMCATIGSGLRLGVDRDLDGRFNGSDCSDGDPGFFAAPVEVADLVADGAPTLLVWSDQTPAVGPALFYEVAGGSLTGLHASGLAAETACLAGDLESAAWDDPRPVPAPGDGFYYVIRARTPECSGGFAPGQAPIEPLDCSGL